MFVGFGMLVVASLTGAATLAWVSVAASVVGAAVLVVSWRRRVAVDEAERIADRTLRDPPRAVEEPETSSAPNAGAALPGATAPSPSVDEQPVPSPPAHERPVGAPPTTSRSVGQEQGGRRGDPAAQGLVAILDQQVLVVDEQPGYHLPGCPVLSGQRVVGLPVKEAIELDFTPCTVCTPLRVLASAEPALENYTARRR